MKIGVLFLYFLVVLVGTFFNYMVIYSIGYIGFKFMLSIIILAILDTTKLFIPLSYHSIATDENASIFKSTLWLLLWMSLIAASAYTIYIGVVDIIRFNFPSPEFMSIENIAKTTSGFITGFTTILGLRFIFSCFR